MAIDYKIHRMERTGLIGSRLELAEKLGQAGLRRPAHCIVANFKAWRLKRVLGKKFSRGGGGTQFSKASYCL